MLFGGEAVIPVVRRKSGKDERRVSEMKRKTARTAALLGATLAVVLAGRGGVAAEWIEQPSWRVFSARSGEDGIRVQTVGENLMLLPGVRVTADSQEGKAFEASLVRDGISDDTSLRWSSDNDWEDAQHWLQAEFSQPRKVGLVRIYWERTNAESYALEYSSDGKNWEQAAVFENCPETTVQDIVLEQPAEAAYWRLYIRDVSRQEEDLSLYYQNVSVLELELYERVEDVFLIETPEIPAGENRQLVLPQVPEGYELTFAGCDYEMLVDAGGKISDTVAAVTAELGFSLSRDGHTEELPGLTVTIPPSAPGTEGSAGKGALPGDLIVREWAPGEGSLTFSDGARIVLSEGADEGLKAVAELFARELSDRLGTEVSLLLEGDGLKPEAGDIFLSASSGEASEGLGEEGYRMVLNAQSASGERVSDASAVPGAGIVSILARTAQGVRWGCVTLLDLMEEAEGTGGTLPAGVIRDYPRYSVRGFGIDVGRRPVSLELLYRIVEELSRHKMNTLQIHLNDNQIIAQSEYDGTEEGARNLYAGFRLESDIRNGAGEGITSTDLFYTKEEFMELIETAKAYGVEIVPEIDTPAHSLALTKAFPSLGLSGNPESVDQLDLSNPEASELVKDLWGEYLTEDSHGRTRKEGGGDSVFGECRTLHIGMDEYFGEKDEYLSYLTELSSWIRETAPDKEIRVWASLSEMAEDLSTVPKDLQMQVWDTSWADPEEMYEAGFPILNSLSSSLYLIPGGGYDWMDRTFLEEEWQPNIFRTAERTWILPAWSERMLGACYMMWNDWWRQDGKEISEEDLFARFQDPLPAISRKLWGED